MEKSLKRKIITISLVIAFVSLAGIIIAFVLGFGRIAILPTLFLSGSILTIISLYAIDLSGKSWARKLARYSLFLLPVSGLISILIAVSFSEYSIGFYVSLLFTLSFLILTLVHLFLYTDATSLTSIIIFLTFSIVGIYFKRMHWPLAGLIISIFSLLLSAGSYIYGIRCLTLAGKNTYFRNVSFSGSLAITIAFLGYFFKMQHWILGGYLTIAGIASLVIVTIYVLITLPSSGYIDWQPYYKKILRRILIPGAFIFILFISRYFVPELNTLIWTPSVVRSERKAPSYGFEMRDYTIEEKNGLKQE